MEGGGTSSRRTPSGLEQRAGRIVAVYVAVAVLWVFFSDRLLLALTADPQRLAVLQTAKGWLFVAATAPLLFLLIRRALVSRRAAEEALRQSEALLRAIVQGTTDAVFVKDAGGRYRLVNHATAAIMGRRPEEVVGLDDRALFSAAETAVFREVDRQVIATGEPVTFEEQVTSAAGATLTMLTTKGPILDEAGEVIGLFGIARDITERKREEEERSRLASACDSLLRRLQLQFERMPFGCLVTTPDLTIREVNPAAERLFGFSRAELVGRSPYDLLVPDSARPYVESFLQRLVQGDETLRGVNENLTRDGRPILCEWHDTPLRDEAGQMVGLMAMVRDITEEQQSEQALRESEERLRRAQEIAHLGSWELDLVDDSLTWSDEVYRIFGLQPQQFGATYEAFLEAVHPEDRAAVHEAYSASLREGRDSYEIEHRVVRKSTGEIRHVHEKCEHFRDETGRIIRSVGMVHDITERKLAEEKLKDLNRTLRVLSRCNETLVRAKAEDELLRAICDNLVELGGYPMAWVGFADEGGTIRAAAQAGMEASRYAERHADLPAAEQRHCPTARAISSRQTVVIQSLRRDAGFSHFRDLAESHGVAAVISLPLAAGGETLGALTIYSREEDDFDPEEVKLLTELADDLAYGIVALRTRAARREAEAELVLRHRAVEASSDGIMICDARAAELPILYVNPAFERITGYAATEASGRNPLFLLGDDRRQMALEEIAAAWRQKREGHAELRCYRKNGSLFWSELSVAPVRDAEGRVTHYVGILSDVTDRKRYQQQLEHQANHDLLTGLANRNLLADRLQQGIAQTLRARRLLAVMLLDLDRFKVINDSLGHNQGDALLQGVGKRLASIVRSGDTVARLGGDEFVVAVGQIAEVEEIALVAHKIMDTFVEPHRVAGREITVNASIGISLCPRDGGDGETLLRTADIAMYRAKEEGGGTFRFYAPEMNLKVLETLELEADLRRALERGEMLLHYQPKVDLATGAIAGAEALLRWRHPQRDMIAPASFIPLAEETGLILPIGEWVLATVCGQIRQWQDEGLSSVPVSVNLSPRQFRKEDLAVTVHRILWQSSLDARWLELELTESMIMRDPQQAAETMHQLKMLGVRLALDDFGTGYSSLNYLRRFPVDCLKIDRSFICDVPADPSAAAVANSVAAIAHSLGLTTIAEGVETREQLDFLLGCGCDGFQGFLFSRPVPPEEFAALLREGRRLER